MEDSGTDTLRKLAPCWSLAGDERLLTILQDTHQRLIAKCQETNTQLEHMATSLDDASISLQNVNNQFMALSSSQFIESRVYDDDVEETVDTPVIKESLKPSPPDELTILKRSIAVIESTHELITIVHDSDTESDTDDELPDRLVMKPKDVYAVRPLPYIIGSEPWKNKWHAGLLVEDSDSDSTTSKVDREIDQYSQSEPEDFEPDTKIQDIMSPKQHVRNISDTSSELPSESTSVKPTPSDVASEIARRLGTGGLPPKMPEPEYEEPTRPTVKKIYKPQEPVASTIFPDEPPPLDNQSDSDADIFADLHRNQPYKQPYTRQYPPEDLFGGNETEDEGADIFSDFANQPSSVTKPTSLFDAGPKPNMFRQTNTTEQPTNQAKIEEQPTATSEQQTTADTNDDRSVKKPVGGISLFGSNKGTESIGAAILKRNQRKSSTSGDESGNDVLAPPSPVKQQSKKEKDIFDDLFAKTQSKQVKPAVGNIAKDIKQEIQRKKEEKIKKDTPASKPVDLFSDNLFDDIDDIFTTNIVKTSKDTKDKQKSIFEDDDDLFSEIAEPKIVTHEIKNKNDSKKSLFDSDDDLFSENITKSKPDLKSKPESIVKTNEIGTKTNEKPTKINETIPKAAEPTKINESPKAESTKSTKPTSIFDDDEDDIVDNIKTNKINNDTKVQNVIASTLNTNFNKNVFKSPSLFDDDDDDDGDLFGEPKKTTQKNPEVDKVISSNTDIKSKDVAEINETENLSSNLNILPKETSIKADDNIIRNEDMASPNSASKPLEDEKPTNDINLVKEDSNINVNTENKDTQNIPNAETSSETNNTNAVSKPIQQTADTTITKTTAIDKMFDNNDKTTDDDFSEQDFDDEPIEETKPHHNETSNIIPEIISNEIETKVPDIETINTHKVIDNIFDNSPFDDDIFSSPINIPSQEKPNLDKTEILENKKTEIDNNKEKSPESEIFNDIVTEPPAFEKPKEPKRSKNVNALFDDDSDDEALFFKKDDVISDERPEDFTAKQDRLFGLFTDEPPDEDLDEDIFTTMPKPKVPSEKIEKSSNLTNDIPIINEEINIKTTLPDKEIEPFRDITMKPEADVEKSKEDVFEKPNTETSKETNIFNDQKDLSETKRADIHTGFSDDDDDGLFQSLPVHLSQPKMAINNQEINYKSDEELFTSLPPDLEKPAPSNIKTSNVIPNKDIFKVPTHKTEVRKVGKLKVGLNINVNALLPGASPKKVKPVDSPDGEIISPIESPTDDSKSTKILSFDGKPESEILDNKLSKERPRIQVKRRPSTRKARREAVRKSGIDFGEDSTDNSSSIDDPPKIKADVIKDDKIINNAVKDTNIKDEGNKNENIDNKYEDPDIPIQVKKLAKTENTPAEIETPKPAKSDITTKIVYILNDEDIFKPSSIENTKKSSLDENPGTNVPKNTDVAKNIDSNIAQNSGIKTLGNTYQIKGDESKKPSKSLFGDDDDDKIFKNKKPVAKSSIFDSESDEELFGVKKVEQKKIEKKVEVKGSLFGDDDDDDLFGVKTKKNVEPQLQPPKSTQSVKETPKPIQPVFEDPLSMFGDDE